MTSCATRHRTDADRLDEHPTTWGKLARCAAAILIAMSATPALAGPVQEANKRLATEAMRVLLTDRDAERAVRLYFGRTYLQHNPTIPDGADGLPRKIATLPADFRYEPGIVMADGDLVMMHGRYTGWGPKPLVVVDVFRVRDGRLVEHWDVMEEDVPASQTKSGRPMFPIPEGSAPRRRAAQNRR